MPMTANGTGGSSELQRGLEARVGERGELAAGDLERREPEEVARRDAQELAPLEAAEARAPLLRVARATQRLERRVDELAAVRSRHEIVVVAEDVDELGLAPQRVADDAARPEDAARPLGGAGRVAERSRPRWPHASAPSASRRSCSSPRSGSGVSDSQSRITGRSCCITRERAGRDPSSSSRSAAPVRSTSANPNAASRSSAASGGEAAGARERVEHRREEEALVDRADRGLVRSVVGLEASTRGPVRAVAVAEDAGEARRAPSGRPGACASAARRRAGGGARRCGGRRTRRRAARRPALDVAAVRELLERVERRGGPDRLVVAAVHELQELHRELDVADPAAPTLELAVGEALARPSRPPARAFIARTSRTASGSSTSGHTNGAASRP